MTLDVPTVGIRRKHFHAHMRVFVSLQYHQLHQYCRKVTWCSIAYVYPILIFLQFPNLGAAVLYKVVSVLSVLQGISKQKPSERFRRISAMTKWGLPKLNSGTSISKVATCPWKVTSVPEEINKLKCCHYRDSADIDHGGLLFDSLGNC